MDMIAILMNFSNQFKDSYYHTERKVLGLEEKGYCTRKTEIISALSDQPVRETRGSW